MTRKHINSLFSGSREAFIQWLDSFEMPDPARTTLLEAFDRLTALQVKYRNRTRINGELRQRLQSQTYRSRNLLYEVNRLDWLRGIMEEERTQLLEDIETLKEQLPDNEPLRAENARLKWKLASRPVPVTGYSGYHLN